MRTRKSGWLLLATIALAFVSGCQTWIPEAGLTLYSPYYLKHPPQYFPPSDPFPAQKELRSLEEAHRKNLEEQR
jgi:hypothetical protein